MEVLRHNIREKLYNTLQHAARHCNTLQHTSPHCTTLQHTASHCNTLHHTASHCTTLHYTHCNTLLVWKVSIENVRHNTGETQYSTLQHNATHYNTLQLTAAHCNTLLAWKVKASERHSVRETHCNTLQQAATHCNTPQHTHCLKGVCGRRTTQRKWKRRSLWLNFSEVSCIVLAYSHSRG